MMLRMKNIREVRFYDLCDEWLDYKKTKVKESTYFNYNFVVNDFLKKYFDNLELEELEDFNYYLIIDKLKGSLSRKTLQDRISILKSILKYGEKRYDSNFKTDLINTPSNYNKEIEILKEREKNRITNHLIKSKKIKELGIFISLYVGLRIGEVCALRWKDIDFEKKIIDVNKTVQRIYMGEKESKVIFTDPKTVKSIRKVPINGVLLKN